jgi:hypothetical protein
VGAGALDGEHVVMPSGWGQAGRHLLWMPGGRRPWCAWLVAHGPVLLQA